MRNIFFIASLLLGVSSVANADKILLEGGIGASQSNFNVDNNAHSIVKWRDLNALNGRLGAGYKFNEDAKIYLTVDNAFVRSGEVSDDDIENSWAFNGEKINGFTCGPDNCAIYSKTKSLTGNTLSADLMFSLAVQESFSVRGGIKYKSLSLDPKWIYQVAVLGTNGIYTNNSGVSIQKLSANFIGPALGVEYFQNFETAKFGVQFDAFLPASGKMEFKNWDITGKNPGVYDDLKVSSLGDGYGFDLELYSIIKYNYFDVKYYSYFNYVKFTDLKGNRYKNQNGVVTSEYGVRNVIYTKIGLGISLLFEI